MRKCRKGSTPTANALAVEPVDYDTNVARAAFRVASEFREGLWHEVSLLKSPDFVTNDNGTISAVPEEKRTAYWVCECEHFQLGNARCKHLEAVLAVYGGVP